MATLIKNGSNGTLTLPRPLNGVLGQGIRVVVLDEPDVVLQYFLGSLPKGVCIIPTPTPTGELLAEAQQRSSVGTSASAVSFWVDERTGSDKNDGSESNPLRNIDTALRIMGSGGGTLHLKAPISELGYESEEFWKPRYLKNTLLIVGEDNVEIAPALPVDSIGSGIVYDYSSSAPGWTPGQFAGMHQELVSTTTGLPTGMKRTIVWNTADTLIVGAPYFVSGIGFPAVNDTFRIVVPGVAVRCDQGANDKSRNLYGGPVTGARRSSSDASNVLLQLENIELRLPDGNNDRMFCSGEVSFYGVHFTKNTSSVAYFQFAHGTFRPGQNVSGDDFIHNGWGFTLRDRDPATNPVRPASRYEFTDFDGYLVGGGAEFIGGSEIALRGGLFDGTGRTGFPHASIYSSLSHVATQSNSRQNLYIINFDGEWDFESEQGRVEIFKTYTHLGDGRFARSRVQGYVTYGAAPINAGAGAGGIDALYGGQIRITGGDDGLVLGEFVAGQTPPSVRAAAAWSVNEEFQGSNFSTGYRTS